VIVTRGHQLTAFETTPLDWSSLADEVTSPLRYLSSTVARRPESIGVVGTRAQQVLGIGDLGGHVGGHRAAEVLVGGVVARAGDVLPAAALRDLGDVAQEADLQRRAWRARGVIAHHADLGGRRAHGDQALASGHGHAAGDLAVGPAGRRGADHDLASFGRQPAAQQAVQGLVLGPTGPRRGGPAGPRRDGRRHGRGRSTARSRCAGARPSRDRRPRGAGGQQRQDQAGGGQFRDRVGQRRVGARHVRVLTRSHSRRGPGRRARCSRRPAP
jgi:hypothetical protein